MVLTVLMVPMVLMPFAAVASTGGPSPKDTLFQTSQSAWQVVWLLLQQLSPHWKLQP